jgi:hypothetical protein
MLNYPIRTATRHHSHNAEGSYTSFTMRRFLLVAIALLLTFPAQAQSPTDPPPGQHPILTVFARGVQIYTCQISNGSAQWVFQAPEATLYDTEGAKVGTHSAGPIWTNKDGSSVKGEVVQKNPAPEPNAIPWLLLKAAGVEGNGILAKVEFIRRSDTHGGTAPTAGCESSRLQTVSRIPYTATYIFYTAKP